MLLIAPFSHAKYLQLPLADLSPTVFAALYAHDADMWSAITVDTVRELKKLPDGSARLIALLRHIHQSLSRTSQLPAIDTVLTVHMRNCCHLIARVCPVLFENCSVEQVDEMFWLPTVNAQLPLGRALVDVCLELMFLPQFCCSSSNQIWSQGLGSFVPTPQKSATLEAQFILRVEPLLHGFELLQAERGKRLTGTCRQIQKLLEELDSPNP